LPRGPCRVSGRAGSLCRRQRAGNVAQEQTTRHPSVRRTPERGAALRRSTPPPVSPRRQRKWHKQS
jgi:hypothetical protein